MREWMMEVQSHKQSITCCIGMALFKIKTVACEPVIPFPVFSRSSFMILSLQHFSSIRVAT